jgi:ribosome-associated protein
MKTKEKLTKIIRILEDMKAEDIKTIDAVERTALTDHFVLCTATSNTHARAIADDMHLKLKALGVRTNHVEMDTSRDWTVLDYDDVIVHVFLAKAREFYKLEELWQKAEARREKEPKEEGTAKRPRKVVAKRPPLTRGLAKKAPARKAPARRPAGKAAPAARKRSKP